ncbi:MAG: hypothetical protein ACJAZV_000779 [Roseivirga sp.]|jgi:hypothetical protein
MIENLDQEIQKLQEYSWWDEANDLPFIQSLVEANSKVDSLVASSVLQSKINTNPLFISFHVTSNSGIEPLVFIKAQGFEWIPANVQSLAKLWFGKEIVFDSRVFNDQVIYESTLKENKWGFLVTGGYLVLSSNSVLLEDVIRTSEGDNFRLIKSNAKFDSKISGVRFLLNADRLSRFINVLTGGSNDSQQKVMSGLLSFVVEPSEDAIAFKGIGGVTDEVLAELPSNAPIKAENFIPSSATFVKWFGVGNRKSIALPNFNASQFISFQNAEVCEIQLDLGDKSKTTVLLAEVTDIESTRNLLNEYSLVSRAEGDTLFSENYISSEIRFVNRMDFFATLYGQEYSSMDKPFYAFFNNILLMSDKIDGLKTVLNDYEAENTWGRIPVKRRYLDNLIQEANITQLTNFEYYLDPLLDSFNPKWKQFFKSHNRLFSSFENFSFQVNANANNLLVSAELTFNQSIKSQVKTDKISDNAEGNLKLTTNAYADTSITSKPFVVRNHDNGAQELIFQDQLNQLYLVDRNGNTLWKKAINGKINGSIEQIDFYSNRKLQYLMFTDSSIYVIDRNGDNVENFPKAIKPELPLIQYTVVDYDNSKNYRYATTDRRGNVYLLEKNGDQLEGWNPKSMGSPLLAAPEHVRIRGRDCFVIVQSNGDVNLITRMGDSYPGFPVSLNKRLSGDYFIKQGQSFIESNIQVVSEDGELVTIDFNASIKGRNQLLKPSVQSRFIGVRDKLNTRLLILRRDNDRLTFFDEKGAKKFEKEIPTVGQLVFEYYNFRNDSELYIIQNLANGDLSVLNDQGENKLVKNGFTKNPIGIFYFQNRREYELLVNFDNQMAIYTFAK